MELREKVSSLLHNMLLSQRIHSSQMVEAWLGGLHLSFLLSDDLFHKIVGFILVRVEN